MKQLPSTYIVNTPISVKEEIYTNLANREAQKKVIVVTTTGDGTGYTKVITYNLGVLTGKIGQTTDGYEVVQYLYNNKSYWTTTDGLIIKRNLETVYYGKAESAADTLIKYNKQVFEDILLASEFVSRLEKKGYDCSKYRQEIKQLYDRFEKRQNYLIGYSEKTQYTEPKLLSNSLSKIVNGELIGIAVTTVIILTVVVTAAFSSLAWFVFYTYGSEAKSDCRKSKELNKILADVDPETREQLYNYIDKYADSFYKKAVLRTKTESLLSSGKNILLLFGGGALVYWFLNKKD